MSKKLSLADEYALALRQRAHMAPSVGATPSSWLYGIVIDGDGARKPFAVKSQGKVPEHAVFVSKGVGSQDDMIARALRRAEAGVDVEAVEIAPGSLASYDGESVHFAIVLTVEQGECKALFFTSQVDWAERGVRRPTRRVTKDEMALAGFVSKMATYLALVSRPATGFTAQPGVKFPAHRVEALKKEFGVI